MTVFIKLVIDLACGALNAGGGYHWLFMRRFIMPAVIGLAVSCFSHTWWLGLTCLGAMGTLCMGYSKIGNWFRPIWNLIQAAALSTGCLLLGHLPWYLFIPYLGICYGLGWLYISWWQPLGDFIDGVFLCSFVWFVH